MSANDHYVFPKKWLKNLITNRQILMKRLLFIDIKFPLLTGTFVYREVESLKRAGYDITTVSIATPDPDHISKEAAHFLKTTIYLDRKGLLKKLWIQLPFLFKNFSAWINSFKTAIREPEIRGFSDRLRLIYHLILAGYLLSILKNRTFDHIHAPFLTSCTTIAYFVSQFLKIPFSFTMHASNIYINPIMLGTKMNSCKKCITISKYNKKYLIEKYGRHLDKKIHIIHCGIDTEEFQASNEKKDTPPMILAVGQLTERKGFFYLLRAAALLRKKKIEFTCNIIGDGEEREKLITETSRLHIEDKVHFLGRLPQETVKKYLNRASIFVLPSIITSSGGREGIPVALMEAMSMQLPVISTKTVGIPELIENGHEGFLVAEKNPIDLAEALERLLTDLELRSKFGINARWKVIKEFNIANNSLLFKSIFY